MWKNDLAPIIGALICVLAIPGTVIIDMLNLVHGVISDTANGWTLFELSVGAFFFLSLASIINLLESIIKALEKNTGK